MTSAVRTERPQGAPVGPARGSRRALLPLALAAGGLAVALLVQAVFDPFRTDVPLCPVYHLTGLHCPGCGAIRSVHALLDGDLALALRSNAVLMVALPVVALGFGRWTLRRIRGLRTAPPPSSVVLAGAVIAVVFGILRNLPFFWFLAPVSFVGA
ncbi:MAG: DUF2752 domain-containing protein [Brachybacterium faecium]|nr:MAG: DUF2752 domain-containing protein [Brachybacterium faecium]